MGDPSAVPRFSSADRWEPLDGSTVLSIGDRLDRHRVGPSGGGGTIAVGSSTCGRWTAMRSGENLPLTELPCGRLRRRQGRRVLSQETSMSISGRISRLALMGAALAAPIGLLAQKPASPAFEVAAINPAAPITAAQLTPGNLANLRVGLNVTDTRVDIGF